MHIYAKVMHTGKNHDRELPFPLLPLNRRKRADIKNRHISPGERWCGGRSRQGRWSGESQQSWRPTAEQTEIHTTMAEDHHGGVEDHQGIAEDHQGTSGRTVYHHSGAGGTGDPHGRAGAHHIGARGTGREHREVSNVLYGSY